MSITATERTIEVVHNEKAGRFEIRRGPDVALLQYQRRGANMVILHTEVPEALEGVGIASRLAHAALDYARENNLGVVPLCPFAASYIRRHREYLNLVPENYRGLVEAH
jgi:predicted GNAT family acetyltransferase